MTLDDLDTYLHAHIPLTRYMQMRPVALEPGLLRVALPLAPNVNPHGTVFGGALTALGLVSAWMLLFAAFRRERLEVTLVGKQSRCDFLAPATADCIAETRCAAEDLAALFTAFRARGRARQAVDTVIRVGEREVARHHGVYTALRSLSPDRNSCA